MRSNKVIYREIFEGELETSYCSDIKPLNTYLQLSSSIVPTTKAWIKKNIAEFVEETDEIRELANAEVEAWWNRQNIKLSSSNASEEKLEFLESQNLTEDTIKEIANTNTKCKVWSRKQWDKFIPQLFLEKKDFYDETKFKIVRIPRGQQKLANELYHRIKAKENTFEEIAEKYGHGKERIKNGCIQKMRLNSASPQLVDKLRSKDAGELIPPFRLNEWYIMIEIIDSYSAKLDEKTEDMLVGEAFNSFLAYTSNKLIQKLIKHQS